MLDILFSLHFAAIALFITLMTVGMGFVCALLQKQLLSASAGEWLLEHVYCPLARVLLLMLMAFLIFPLIVVTTAYIDLVFLFTRQSFLTNMVNILFVSSLLLSFLPIFSHPALAMPLLGCIATGLIFLHQIALPRGQDLHWVPSWSAVLYILALATIAHLLSRWSSHHISLWLDYRFNISRTRRLVLDIHYLVLQMPILLAYGHSLYQQTMQQKS